MNEVLGDAERLRLGRREDVVRRVPGNMFARAVTQISVVRRWASGKRRS